MREPPHLALHLDVDGPALVRSRATAALDRGAAVTVFDRRATETARIFRAIRGPAEVVVIGTRRTLVRGTAAAAVEAGLAMAEDVERK